MNVEMPTAGRKEAGLGRSSSVADHQRQSQKQQCNEVGAHLHILPQGTFDLTSGLRPFSPFRAMKCVRAIANDELFLRFSCDSTEQQ